MSVILCHNFEGRINEVCILTADDSRFQEVNFSGYPQAFDAFLLYGEGKEDSLINLFAKGDLP